MTIGDSGRTGCCITLIVILVMLGFSITGTHIAPKQERCKMIIALGKSILKPPNTVGYGWKGAQHFWVAKKSINVVRSLTSTSIDVPIKYTAIAWPFKGTSDLSPACSQETMLGSKWALARCRFALKLSNNTAGNFDTP